MSAIVTVETKIKRADLAERAFRRRFKEVKASASRITFQVKPASRNFDIGVTLNLSNMKIDYDGDYKGITEQVNEAYLAEEVIAAAEAEGRAWTETRNDNNELVFEIDY